MARTAGPPLPPFTYGPCTYAGATPPPRGRDLLPQRLSTFNPLAGNTSRDDIRGAMQNENRKQLIVVGDRVLIAPEEGEDRSRVGLYLPASAIDAQAVQTGTIVA